MGAALITFKAFSFAPEINQESNKVSIMSNETVNHDNWHITNDGVMGGLSEGAIDIENNNIKFFGTISTENNGGFTSTFKRISSLPKYIDSIRVRVKGDGNLFQLRVISQVSRYSLAYKVSFLTDANKVTSHTFKLADFTASFRGREIDNAPLLTASTIEQIGFLYTKKQPGSFVLSIQDIDFFESQREKDHQ